MKRWSKKDANNIIKLIDEASGSVLDRIQKAANQTGLSYNSCYYVYYKRRTKSKPRKVAKRTVTKPVGNDMVHALFRDVLHRGMKFEFTIKRCSIVGNRLIIEI